MESNLPNQQTENPVSTKFQTYYITAESVTKFFIPKVIAHTGDIITWTKPPDSDLILFIPDPRLFGAFILETLDGKISSVSHIIEYIPEAEEEIFRYAVYHKGVRDFLESNSSPEIIVRR